MTALLECFVFEGVCSIKVIVYSSTVYVGIGAIVVCTAFENYRKDILSPLWNVIMAFKTRKHFQAVGYRIFFKC